MNAFERVTSLTRPCLVAEGSPGGRADHSPERILEKTDCGREDN